MEQYAQHPHTCFDHRTFDPLQSIYDAGMVRTSEVQVGPDVLGHRGELGDRFF